MWAVEEEMGVSREEGGRAPLAVRCPAPPGLEAVASAIAASSKSLWVWVWERGVCVGVSRLVIGGPTGVKD
mgnify:CR=1 FL=1